MNAGSAAMSALGSWTMTLSTPMGPQSMQLEIFTLDPQLKGRVDSSMGSFDITGTGTDARLAWVMEVKKPVPIAIAFDVLIEADTMTGSAKMGSFGKARLVGARVTAGVAPPQMAGAGPITEHWQDPQFHEPYVEVNELRSEPVPHRYVHGGFTGTGARFSFYFPPAEAYQGRFFQNTYPMATSSDIGPFPIAFDVAIGNLGFTVASGAYYVQTNLGGADRAPPADPAIAAYRVNAAAAKYSRIIAAELYGVHRPYGYLFGGSGGSYQVMGAAENTSGIWDGFVPYVLGTPNAIPSMFTVRMHTLRVLRQRGMFAAVMDAINPGGSGDPYAELNKEEAGALREASLLGFPLPGWWNHESLTSGYFPNVAAIVPAIDPSYVDDFWTKPGYLGTDPTSRVGNARGTFDTTVAEVIPCFPAKVRLAALPEADLADAHLIVLSGAAEGKSVPLADIAGDTVEFAYAGDPSIGPSLRPGDRVRFDNSWALALQTYQRHQVPDPGIYGDLYGWDQFRDADGQPVYPQREMLTGPIGAGATAGSVPDGSIKGKVLVVECLMDIDAMPWQADWYRSQVKAKLGDAFDDNFALWFIDHAQHDNPPQGLAQAHTVSFEGALQQALRDLSKWVEEGVRPSQTNYAVVDTQIVLPATAAERCGVQPAVDLKADGGVRTEVTAGTVVAFSVSAEAPPDAGEIVSLEWDFRGTGNFFAAAQDGPAQGRVEALASHVYLEPGTYFPVVRATLQRDGDAKSPYGRIQNIARARVVVT